VTVGVRVRPESGTLRDSQQRGRSRTQSELEPTHKRIESDPESQSQTRVRKDSS
jgi:hypothetical protein